MKILSKQLDSRISTWNILIELTFGEYLPIAEKTKKNNIFQRKRVRSSKTVYTLLKDDLKQGCVIPPIILALNESIKDIENEPDEKLISFIKSNIDSIQILDGLQRTFTILDVVSELNEEENRVFLKRKLRIEIYIGISRTGILYRMLTLNTGQTPMSLRHQVEILYKDFLEESIGEISFISEKDGEYAIGESQYKFKEAIEGFNSYVNRDELALDKQDVLQNIKSLGNLSKESQEVDLFEKFIYSFHKFYLRFVSISDNWSFDKNDFDRKLNKAPFGKDVKALIKKSQAITGFGAAIGKLIDQESFNSFEDLNTIIDDVNFSNDPRETINELIRILDEISNWSKKIGNDQRMFFMFFFRELFDKKGEAFKNIDSAISEGYSMYERKTK